MLFVGLLSVATAAAGYELANVLKRGGWHVPKYLVGLAGLLLPWVAFFWGPIAQWLTVLVASAWPVASLVLAHRQGTPDLATVGARLRLGERENALVWRPQWRPGLRACSDAEATLLQALLRGANLPDALEAASATDPAFDLGQWLPQAVQSGLVCGVTDIHPSTTGASP